MSEPTNRRPKPPEENLARVGSQPFDMHVKRGIAILELLEGKIEKHGKRLDSSARVYDFGCGVGRVIIPFAEKHDVDLFGSDVDHTAIEFLNSHFSSKFKSVTTGYEPPLPFDDDYFDIMYSISVWSHFPPDLQIPWLLEMRRIMKKDGLLLISTTGVGSLETWHKKGKRLDITVETLTDAGMLFINNHRLAKRPEMFPGVTGDWGVLYQTPDHVRKTWSEVFEVIEISESSVGKQDLVVLKNSKK